MKATTTTAPTTTTATVTAPIGEVFSGADFAHKIMLDKKRGTAGFGAIKGATLLIDALRRAGCEQADLSDAIMEIARAYRGSLTESAVRAHGDAVRLIAGV